MRRLYSRVERGYSKGADSQLECWAPLTGFCDRRRMQTFRDRQLGEAVCIRGGHANFTSNW